MAEACAKIQRLASAIFGAGAFSVDAATLKAAVAALADGRLR